MDTCDHGNMIRNDNDEWPNDHPVGRFSIHVAGLEGYPGSTAHILFECPKGQRCSVILGPQAVPRSAPDRACIWGWDGNLDKPTLTPSINCITEKDGKPTGGCGWHGHIINGVIA